MFYILIAIALIWLLFSTSKEEIANILYSSNAAPWETIDGFYYPNNADLTEDVRRYGFDTLEDCRDWVYDIADEYKDPDMTRSDYECAIGKIDNPRMQAYGVNVYRLTLR